MYRNLFGSVYIIYLKIITNYHTQETISLICFFQNALECIICKRSKSEFSITYNMRKYATGEAIGILLFIELAGNYLSAVYTNCV